MYIDKFFELIKVLEAPYTKIRLGRKSDGGYVVPDEICKDIQNVYSIGISDDVSFEEEFAERYKSSVTCFDDSIKELPVHYLDLHFFPIGVGATPRLPMRRIRREYMKGEHILLKVDIEGNEWEHIDYYGGYDVMIIELHALTVEPMSVHKNSLYFQSLCYLFSIGVMDDLFKKYYEFLSALLNNYFIFHIHGNNSLPKTMFFGYKFPPLLELTLVNRKFKWTNNVITEFPVKELDYPNKTDRPDFESLFPFKNG